MRIYEELFIVKPDSTEEDIDQVVEQLRQVITDGGGAIEKVEKWGLRKLAYRVQKHNDGNYILLQFSSSPDTVKEIERRLRVADQVLKFITVRIDLNLKRLEKRKKQREKRAARKPPPASPVPQAPAAEPFETEVAAGESEPEQQQEL